MKLLSTFAHLFNKWLHAAANIVEEHTFKKCSPYATVSRTHVAKNSSDVTVAAVNDLALVAKRKSQNFS